MNSVASRIGIDIHKDELVTSIDEGKTFRTPNKKQNCEQLVKRLAPGSVVAIERSGGYERVLVKVLLKSGIEVRAFNPLHPRRMAQAMGCKAKTDPIDAVMLSRFANLLPAAPLKSLERQVLSDHSRAIQCLKQTVGEYKERVAMPELDPSARKLYLSLIKSAERLIRKHEDELIQRVKESSCGQRFKLAQSVRTIGPVAARVIVCELPENFATQRACQICSYGGLAPMDRSSGKHNPPARLGRGNTHLKAALYMPAVTALRREEWARNLYARLRQKGRTHDQAIVPIMRRLLTRVVVVLKRGTPWEDEPPKR